MLTALAWRNLWRNKRRTWISISAVVFATWLSLLMRGIQLGTYEENMDFVLGLFTGYLQLQHPSYDDNPTLHNSIRFDAETEARLRDDDRVEAYATRVVSDGLVSYRENSLGAILLGIDPLRERGLSRLTNTISEGRMIASTDAQEVVLGSTMLENLKARVGDEIVILTQGFDGSLGNMKYTIVGTVKTGLHEFDRGAVFVGLRSLQELVFMHGRVSMVAVRTRSLHEVDAVVRELNEGFDASEIRALSWEQVMPEFKQAIDLDNYSGMLLLGILIVVVAFGILNTVLMSVTERFREFGVLLAIGMPNSKLVMLVFMETMFITLLGVLGGNVLGFAVNSWFAANPIVFTGEYVAMIEEYGWLPQMRSTVKLSSFVNTSFAVILLATFSVLYPLRRVARLEALKGIRYT